MTDKMREEFEAIHPMPLCVMRCGDGYAASNYGWMASEYISKFEGFVIGWRASRAALYVNLPDSERSVECGDVLYRSDVEQALDDAGVSYK